MGKQIVIGSEFPGEIFNRSLEPSANPGYDVLFPEADWGDCGGQSSKRDLVVLFSATELSGDCRSTAYYATYKQSGQ